MAYATTPRRFYRKNSLNEKKFTVPSLVVHIDKSGIVTTPLNDQTYRTEVYLQQREKQDEDKSSSSATITTWKNLKYQKRILDNDQVEIDRVLSTMDSIHGIFNRSLLIPYNQVYSSLYGDDDQSTCLMKTFCQRQDYYMNYKSYNHDTNRLGMANSFKNFQDTDLDDDTEGEEEEAEKKKSYDSGYGSVMPMKHFSRESFLKIAQSLSLN
jgi:hypothetical protein